MEIAVSLTVPQEAFLLHRCFCVKWTQSCTDQRTTKHCRLRHCHASIHVSNPGKHGRYVPVGLHGLQPPRVPRSDKFNSLTQPRYMLSESTPNYFVTQNSGSLTQWPLSPRLRPGTLQIATAINFFSETADLSRVLPAPRVSAACTHRVHVFALGGA